MDFSRALIRLKGGDKMARAGWNAGGQWVVYQAGYPEGIPINKNTAEATEIPEGTVCCFRPYLMLRAADASFVPWAPTVSDVLADDWQWVSDANMAAPAPNNPGLTDPWAAHQDTPV